SARLGQRIDAEDVVQSVYRSFFAGAAAGRYDLQRGGDLWRLLAAITLYKLRDQVKHHGAGKRQVERDETFGSEKSLLRLQNPVLSQAPTPMEAATLADELEQLMRRLEPQERRMLEMRLQGHNLEEIAATTDLSRRSVSRVLE